MTAIATPIVIGIPTYQRPEQLRQLLETLIPEVATTPAMILIADNACSPATEDIVAEFAPRLLTIWSIPVPERGLAAVRNAIVREASNRCPEWQWLAMLDDDGLATADWLKNLIACGEHYHADLVGGPVEGLLPPNTSRLARNSIFAQRKRWKTGPVPTLNTTQNLLISQKLVAKLGQPLFNAEYGASGGEDYELFRRTAKAGGVIIWCDEAVVLEPTPAHRLEQRQLLWRYYSTGLYMARIDIRFDGRVRTAFRSMKGLAGACLRLTRSFLISRNLDASARGLLTISHYLGRIVGVAGGRGARYQ